MGAASVVAALDTTVSTTPPKNEAQARELARYWPDLSEEERRAIELEENVERDDLTPEEQSRQMVAEAEMAADEVLADSAKTPKGGRPPKNGHSEEAVAHEMGVPRKTLNDAKQHVAALDRYPALDGLHLPKSVATKAAKALDSMPEEERSEVFRLAESDDSRERDRADDSRRVPRSGA